MFHEAFPLLSGRVGPGAELLSGRVGPGAVRPLLHGKQLMAFPTFRD